MVAVVRKRQRAGNQWWLLLDEVLKAFSSNDEVDNAGEPGPHCYRQRCFTRLGASQRKISSTLCLLFIL